MKSYLKYSILVCLGVGLVYQANAQTDTKGGAVSDQEFIIRKDRVLTLPKQPRSFEKLPVLPQPKGLDDFNYIVSRYGLQLRPLSLDATAAQKVYRKDRRDLYPGYIKAGYGNFASPLFEARLMATEVDDFNYSFEIDHQSFGKGPVMEEQSRELHSHIGFDGSYFTDQVEVFAGVDWNQDTYSFYGVDMQAFEDPEFETVDNTFNTIGLHVGFRDIEKVAPLSYQLKLGFQTFGDSFAAKELQYYGDGVIGYQINDDWKFESGINYFGSNPENLNYKETRTYFSIRPKVSARFGSFDFEAGINVVSENDSLENKSSDFRIFPNLRAQYQIADEFGIFAEFSGDVERRTYHSFLTENPFLGPNDRLLNTVNNYHAGAGIEGRFGDLLDYIAFFNVDRYNQLYFFVNTPEDPSQFSIIYDDKSTVASLGGELGLRLSDTYRLASNLKLYDYSLNMVEEAWHRPVWEFGVNNQLRPIDNLLVQATLNFMGGIRVPSMPIDNETPSPYTTLSTIADLQLGADFAITDQFSIFAQGNNLFNGTNARWQNYLVRGIQLVGGLSFKF